MKQFVIGHLRGEFGIIRSFFLHLLLPYILVVGFEVPMQPPFWPSFICFAVLMVWAIGGCAVACVRVLLTPKQPSSSVVTAGLIAILLFVTVYFTVRDAVWWFGLP